MTGKKHLLCAVAIVLFLGGGCSMFGNETENTVAKGNGKASGKVLPKKENPAQKLLTKGMEDYRYGKYYTAVKDFEEIINRYPFSPQATVAELKAADCSYHMKQYKEAESLYESFENNHPTNEMISYVLYQKGMCNYRQIDRIDRDPAGAEKAVRYFKQLVRAFPESPYTADAQEKIGLATDFLAGHELSIARFYIRTKKIPQAKTRLRYLLATYPQSAVAKKGRQLLEQLEKGEKSEKSFFSIPGAGFFTKKEKGGKAAAAAQ